MGDFSNFENFEFQTSITPKDIAFLKDTDSLLPRTYMS